MFPPVWKICLRYVAVKCSSENLCQNHRRGKMGARPICSLSSFRHMYLVKKLMGSARVAEASPTRNWRHTHHHNCRHTCNTTHLLPWTMGFLSGVAIHEDMHRQDETDRRGRQTDGQEQKERARSLSVYCRFWWNRLTGGSISLHHFSRCMKIRLIILRIKTGEL